MRRRLFWALWLRVAGAAVAVEALRWLLTAAGLDLGIWAKSVLAFVVAKAAGDVVALTLFRDTVVLFFEDLLWEMAAFVVLGLAAAGFILLAAGLIGGWVQPFFPALVVYLIYLLAENRQRAGRAGGEIG